MIYPYGWKQVRKERKKREREKGREGRKRKGKTISTLLWSKSRPGVYRDSVYKNCWLLGLSIVLSPNFIFWGAGLFRAAKGISSSVFISPFFHALQKAYNLCSLRKWKESDSKSNSPYPGCMECILDVVFLLAEYMLMENFESYPLQFVFASLVTIKTESSWTKYEKEKTDVSFILCCFLRSQWGRLYFRNLDLF